MKVAEPLPQPESRLYTIYYPSGLIYTFEGVFGWCVLEVVEDVAEFIPYVRDFTDENQRILLDPRAVVTRKEGLVYNPRVNDVATWARDWLREHPEWPPPDLRPETNA